MEAVGLRYAYRSIRMTIAEKIEQAFTGRPCSLVPGKTLARLWGVAPRNDTEMWMANMAMHYGQGALAGALRAVMSYSGVRGPFGDFMFVGIRLTIDQTLENWTGVGAPPWYVNPAPSPCDAIITPDAGLGLLASR